MEWLSSRRSFATPVVQTFSADDASVVDGSTARVTLANSQLIGSEHMGKYVRAARCRPFKLSTYANFSSIVAEFVVYSYYFQLLFEANATPSHRCSLLLAQCLESQ